MKQQEPVAYRGIEGFSATTEEYVFALAEAMKTLEEFPAQVAMRLAG